MSVQVFAFRHRRRSGFYAAAISALIAFVTMLAVAPGLALEIAVIAFSLVYLVLMALRMPMLTPKHLIASPERDDEPAYLILLVTLMVVAAAVVGLFDALNSGGKPGVLEVALAFVSVIGGWFSIHTMFAMHYAHRYWRSATEPDGGDDQVADPRKGLDFPGANEPGGYDFLYFSFVIGMTAQTSDVAITETGMRRLNLGHAVISFFFNTVLVAAAVNAVVSLAG